MEGRGRVACGCGQARVRAKLQVLLKVFVWVGGWVMMGVVVAWEGMHRGAWGRFSMQSWGAPLRFSGLLSGL